MSIALSGPRLAPASGKAKSLVVFLHGYGADGNDLIDIGRMWAGLLPDTAFASPHAPDPHPEAPQGRQWFPLASIEYRTIDQGVRQAVPILDGFLDAELSRYGLADDRLAIVGFSQGTMLALEAGPRRPGKIAGIVGYSGMLSGVDRLATAPHRPPILLVHGAADQLIPVLALQAAERALSQSGFAVESHISPTLGHGIDEDGLRLGAIFLKRVLG